MSNIYDKDLKRKLCEAVCLNNASTIKTAQDYNVPIKTFEKWITAYNKDPHCFDSNDDSNDFKMVNPPKSDTDYEELSNEELIKQLMKKDIEIARLKKNYMVKEGGTGKKEFVIFSKKNTK